MLSNVILVLLMPSHFVNWIRNVCVSSVSCCLQMMKINIRFTWRIHHQIDDADNIFMNWWWNQMFVYFWTCSDSLFYNSWNRIQRILWAICATMMRTKMIDTTAARKSIQSLKFSESTSLSVCSCVDLLFLHTLTVYN